MPVLNVLALPASGEMANLKQRPFANGLSYYIVSQPGNYKTEAGISDPEAMCPNIKWWPALSGRVGGSIKAKAKFNEFE